MAAVHRHKLTLKAHLAGVSTAPGRELPASPAPAPAPSMTLPAPTPLAAVDPAPSQASGQPESLALQQMMVDLARLVEQTRAHDRRVLDEVVRLSVELAVAIAERLLGTEIAANRQRLDAVVLGALERIQAGRTVAVHGHADDLALLQRQLAGHAEQDWLASALAYRPDDGCRRGQWKLQTDEWFMEWDTARCLAELRAALLEATLTDD
jgi:flagellar biosynthesis/type III secretory pathway protein FliH